MAIVMRPRPCPNCGAKVYKDLNEFNSEPPAWVCVGCGQTENPKDQRRT